MFLIKYLNDIKRNIVENDNNVKGSTKIHDILKNINHENISNEFLTIFDEKKNLSVNKVSEIFNYYLSLIFEDIKEEISNFQETTEFDLDKENELNEKSRLQLNEYFEKQTFISKDELENAIKLFITLVLFREKDKINKIKLNKQNIVNYLNCSDLWKNEIYEDDKFKENLDKLRICDIPINHILLLYDYLTNNDSEKDKTEK